MGNWRLDQEQISKIFSAARQEAELRRLRELNLALAEMLNQSRQALSVDL